MKAAFVLFLVAVVATTARADEKTLLGSCPIVSGGFGGPVVKVSQIHGETALFAAARGGWLINHVFSVGGGAYGQVVDIQAPAAAREYYLAPDGASVISRS
jgi:hypothetical protein